MPNKTVRAAATGLPKDTKLELIRVADTLGEARALCEVLYLAANGLEMDDGDPLMLVADLTKDKITEAIASLDEVRGNHQAEA